MSQVTPNQVACASCGSAAMSEFYKVSSVPVHSVLLMRTRDKALSFPRGNISLAKCSSCGFISNAAFKPASQEYAAGYEATQAYSPTFNAFHKKLAERLIERHGLHGKDILEIGCGQGEFLVLLCELGGNRGIGFDPAYIRGRVQAKAQDRVTFINDFYSENYAHYKADFVCCKMTLEHIPNPSEFLSAVRRSIGDRTDTIVFFQVPSVKRILRELAFWDIYYEHCSYFGAASLTQLFQQCDFEVLTIAEEYDDQYLRIEAKPVANPSRADLWSAESPANELEEDVAYFVQNFQERIDTWRERLLDFKGSGARVIVWGSSSKAVAFLTTLRVGGEVDYVVDINPFRQGTYIPGTGHKIVAPGFLREFEPDVVIVMNPIYRDEIEGDLREMDLATSTIISVDQ